MALSGSVLDHVPHLFVDISRELVSRWVIVHLTVAKLLSVMFEHLTGSNVCNLEPVAVSQCVVWHFLNFPYTLHSILL